MDDFQPLPPRARTMIALRALGPSGFVAVVLLAGSIAAVVGDVAGHWVWAGGLAAAAVLIVVVAWLVSGLVYRSYGWRLTEGTVELRHGVIVRRHQVLPRARVQNVTKQAGPVARAWGLATVTVHSAGANTPNITVPDLTVEAGDALRERLLPASSRSVA